MIEQSLDFERLDMSHEVTMYDNDSMNICKCKRDYSNGWWV